MDATEGDIPRYLFQVRDDDGRDHFQAVSTRFASLRFVLVYGDANSGEFGSYLISNGHAEGYLLPSETVDSLMRKHGIGFDSEDEGPYWEASSEAMDLAEARWLKA